MVAVVAGGSLGLERSSAWVLGSRGQSGQAALGGAGGNAYVNATTGNLVLQRTDEILLGRGPDALIGRTYNSLGVLDGDNNDGWRTNVHRTIVEDTATGTITRTNWDGSQDVYVLDSSIPNNTTTYIFKGDDDAWDSLVKVTTNSVVTWAWTDGDTRVTETYENGATVSGVTTWRLTKMTDLDQNQVTYEYTAGLITKVTTAGGDYTLLSYSGSDLTEVSTHLATGSTLTRVRYAYETYGASSAHRLKTVTVDLSPEDNTASAGSIYTTTYTYDGDSTRIASIAHTDPSLTEPMVLLQITYTQVNSNYRVASFTQMAASGEARTTTLSYDTTTLANHTVTTVTDPHGVKTVFTSNQAGQLVMLETSPAAGGSGGTPAPTSPPAGYVLTDGSLTANDVIIGDQNGTVVQNDAIRGWGGNDTLEGRDGNDWLQGGSGVDNLKGGNGNDVLIGGGGEDRLYGGAGADIYVFEPNSTTDIIKLNEFNRADGDKLDFSAFPGLTFADLTIETRQSVQYGAGYLDTFVVVAGQDVVRIDRYSAGLLQSDFIFGTSSADPATNRVLQFEYDADGNVTKVTENGFATYYQYDGDNCVLEQNDLGLTIRRTLGANNQLLRETRYLVADADGYNTGAGASSPLTTRYVYDTGNHLRFVVSGEGMVTEFQYDGGFGQVTRTFRYASQRYAVSGLAETAQIALADLESWAGALNKSTAERTDTAYDYRGSVASVTTYEKLLSSGAVDTTGASTKLLYTYDQAGNVRQRQLDGKSEVEVFVYDGFNRLKSSTDFNGRTTTIAFDDLALTTTVTVADGLQKISTYNRLGELIAYKELVSGDANPPTTTYTYDKLGRLRRVSDPIGIKSYVLYDKLGRKVADIQADGSMVEYGYNADNELIWTVAYKTVLSSTLLGDLEADVTGNQYDVAHYRPAGDAADLWEWRIYDAAHRLVQTIDAAGVVTSFAYDGASRLISTTAYVTTVASQVAGFKTTPPATAIAVAANAADRVSRSFYDADGRLAGALDAEGYLIQFFYDAAGRQIKTIANATQTALSSTATLQNLIDAATPHADDIHTYNVYDGRGDLRIAIGGEGEVTLYEYTPLGDVAKITRGQKLSATELASLRTTPPTLTPPAAAVGTIYDVTEYVRDLYGLVSKETRLLADGGKQVTTYAYDLMYRLVSTTIANGETVVAPPPSPPPSGPAPAPTTPPAGYVSIIGTTANNVINGDQNGVSNDAIQGDGGNDTLDGKEGNDWLHGGADIDNLKGGNGDDVLIGGGGEDRLYGGAGADIYVFEPNSTTDLVKYLEFKRTDGDLLDFSAFAGLTFADLTIQVLQSVNYGVGYWDTFIFVPGQATEVVRLEKYSAGLQSSDFIFAPPASGGGGSTPAPTVDPRTLTKRYNAYGFLIGELSGEGSAALATLGSTPTTAQLDALYAAWGITYKYDLAGRLISRTDPSGAGGAANRTLYYYDTDGRLTHAVNALGEVVEYRYDTFGRRTEIITYDRRIAPAPLSALNGGFTSALLATMAGIPDAATDSRTITAYNVTGTVASITDAEGAVTTFGYNSFRDLLLTTTQLTNTPLAPDGSVDTSRTYDRRGQMLSETVDSSGSLQLKRSFTYDAFGRLLRAYDPNSTTLFRLTGYDRSGQITRQTDELGAYQAFEYDGRGNMISTTDATGRKTTHSFDAFNRQIVTKVGVVDQTYVFKVVTQKNALGDTISVTDGADRTTTYAYDLDGALISATNGLGETIEQAYDQAGRLSEITDARGVVTAYSYDAVGRTISQTVDVGGLNLQTSYVYNSRSQAITVTDAGLRTVSYGYDRNGRMISVTVDPGGLGLTTLYVYDLGGRQVRVHEGRTSAGVFTASRVIAHSYDAAGRLTKTLVDPDGLALKTEYAYDKNGNVVARLDANGKISRFIYDDAGRLTFTVDPAGGVSKTVYDAEGRVVTTIGYVTPVSTASMPAWPSAAISSVTVTTAAGDRINHSVYDKAGRLAYEVDALGYVRGYAYDGSGNLVRTQAFAAPIPVAASYSQQGVEDQIALLGLASHAQTRTSTALYDAAGRRTHAIDADGAVTAFVYDASGNLVEQRRYASLYDGPAQPDQTAMASWIGTHSTGVRSSRVVYDAADRQVFSIDALGRVSQVTYDALGQATTVREFKATFPAADGLETLPTWAGDNDNDTADRVSHSRYDSAGRLLYTVDALGHVVELALDALGAVTSRIEHAGTHTLAEAATLVAGEPNATTARITGYAYDAAGRLIEVTDAAGYKTRMTLDGLGQAVTVKAAYGLADEAVTVRAYDAAGRLQSETRASGTAEEATTTYAYDGQGQVTLIKVAAGTLDEATTAIAYTSRGQVSTQTRAPGQGEQSLTTYAYDAFGDQLSATTGEMKSERDYDRMGRVVTSRTALRTESGNTVWATTVSVYDAFGNLVQVTDPRGSVGHFYYDAIDRLVLQVDPEAYATATSYSLDAGGREVTTVIRHAAKTTGVAGLTTPPTVVADGADAATTVVRDKLGQVVQTTDAEGGSESYVLDAFGDRVTVTNRLGGVTTNTYDKRGLLTKEVIVVGWKDAVDGLHNLTIENQYSYDARGNRTQSIEAANAGAQARTFTYAYDKLDRLHLQTGETVSVVDPATLATSSVTPTQMLNYDRRGNLIETVDAAGARTQYWYDDLDRKIRQVDALGQLTVWEYDDRNNATRMVKYDTAITLPASGDRALPQPVAADTLRDTRYVYDRNNRLIETRLVDVRYGAWNGTSYDTAVADLISKRAYDDAGNLTIETDARDNRVHHYYDRLGREIAKVDAERYLTTWVRDAEGNVLTEVRYATLVPATVTAQDLANLTQTARDLTGAAPLGLTGLTNGLAGADDRKTTFTYDTNGRRLTETRWNVAAASVDATTGVMTVLDADAGANGVQNPNATITYAYNELGQVISKVEANGDATDYGYDSLGRQVWMKEAGFKDHQWTSGADLTRLTTEYSYDGLGNLLSSRQGKTVANSAIDRVTTYAYDTAGRLASVTDAAGFAHVYGYDAAGRVVTDSYLRLKSDGTSASEAQVYRYDLMGRVVQQAAVALSGGTWSFGDRTHVRYNTHGEVTGKGITAGDVTTPAFQEIFAYDNAGRLWKTNSGDGSVKLFVHDKAGNVTLTVTSDGRDLGAYASITAALDAFATAGTLGTANLGDANLTFGLFDKRGLQTGTVEPFRELRENAATPSTLDIATIVRARGFNAFGEVVSETDARGNTTNFVYNAMGRLIRKQSPTVNYTKENGTVVAIRPTEDYYYDIAGRLVGVRDANNTLDANNFSDPDATSLLDAYSYIDVQDRLNTRLLRAGTGHGGDEAAVLTQFNADTSKTKTAYDVFGDARTLTNGLNVSITRAYDKMGRLTSQTGPTQTMWSVTLNDDEDNFIGAPTSSSGALTESYAYDGLGQRIKHWNSTSSAIEKTDYDAQGRVISFVDYGGYATTYVYSAFDASIATGQLGTFGGWIKTTTNTAARTSTEKTDYFGHAVWRSDYGNHQFTFDFDRAGRMVKQTTAQPTGPYPAGYVGTIDYTFYNTGQVRSIYEQLLDPNEGQNFASWRSDRRRTTLGYDAQGNRVFERYETTYAGMRYIEPINGGSDGPPLDHEVPPENPEEENWEPYGGKFVYQNTNVTYDALNRMVSLTDSRPMDDYAVEVDGDAVDTTDDMPLSIAYAYDANGNIRRVDTYYRDVDTPAMQQHKDQWYLYDAMNRVVLARGKLDAGVISRGTYGVSMEYDAAGQRVRQTTTNENGTDHKEQYGYTPAGFLETVSMADGTAAYTQRVLERHDALGRAVYHEERGADGLGGFETVYVRKALYNALSQVTYDQVFSLHSNDFFYRTTSQYMYGGFNVATNTYNGQYQGGGATYIEGTTYKLETNPERKYTTETSNSYSWWEGARQATINVVPDNDDPYLRSASGTIYDFNGNLRDWKINDINSRRIDYTVNANGQVMERVEVSTDDDVPDGARPRQLFYYFNGMQVGDVGNKGAMDVDYAETIRRRTAEPDEGFFPWGQKAASDFGNTYEPINSQTAAGTGYSYTVNAGDTLQTIAVALWGDASLWYLIAEANGLNGSETLVGGQRLSIPNKVVNARNAADTFRVYDPNEGLGDIMPGQPKPPKGDEGCGQAAMIIMVIVAIVVTVVTFGAALAATAPMFVGGVTSVTALAGATVTTGLVAQVAVAGAISGALGSLASQVVGMALHVQDDISWSAVAMGALSGAVGGVVGFVPGLGGAALLPTVGRAVASNVITQGVAVATGLQDRFDWTNVAVGAVTAGVGAMVGGWAQSTFGLDVNGTASQVISGAAGTIAGIATQSLIEGSDFGDNLQAALPNIVATTIGNMIVGGINGSAGDGESEEGEARAELEAATGALQGAVDEVNAAAASVSSPARPYYANSTGHTGIIRASYSEGDGGRITTGGPVSPKAKRGLWGWVEKTFHVSEWLPALKQAVAPIWNSVTGGRGSAYKVPRMPEAVRNFAAFGDDVVDEIIIKSLDERDAVDIPSEVYKNVIKFIEKRDPEVARYYSDNMGTIVGSTTGIVKTFKGIRDDISGLSTWAAGFGPQGIANDLTYPNGAPGLPSARASREQAVQAVGNLWKKGASDLTRIIDTITHPDEAIGDFLTSAEDRLDDIADYWERTDRERKTGMPDQVFKNSAERGEFLGRVGSEGALLTIGVEEARLIMRGGRFVLEADVVAAGTTTVTRTSGRNVVDFTLDAQGNPLSAKGSLFEDFGGGTRSSAEVQAQADAAARGVAGDQGGHLAAYRFMPEQGPINLFPQEGNFNMSAFKTLENDYARYVNAGHQVDFEHTLGNFDSLSGRPGTVDVGFTVRDKSGNVLDSFNRTFKNEPSQAYTRRKY